MANAPDPSNRAVIRLFAATALIGSLALAVLRSNAVAAEELRDFYIKGANSDGTLICAKWCGPTEPCC